MALAKASAGFALAVLATIAVAAQGKPDFSGHWVLIAPKPPTDDMAASLSVQQTLARPTARGEAMEPYFRDITIEWQFPTRTSTGYHQIGVVGGFVSGGGDRWGPRHTTHEAVTWRGNALVFEHGSHTTQGSETDIWTERLETWSLNADGRLLVVISTSSSSGITKVTTLMYQRR